MKTRSKTSTSSFSTLEHSARHAWMANWIIILTIGFAVIAMGSLTAEAKPFPDCPLSRDGSVRVCRNADPDSRELASSKFDLYLPGHPGANATFRPILVIHGGCFTGGDKSDVATIAELMAKNGFAAMAINYTLASDVPGNRASSYPDVLEDMRRQLNWLESPQAFEMKIRTDWIGAYGESSGATLAGYLGTRHLNSARSAGRAAVNTVVDFYGRVDLTRPQPAGKGMDCALKFLNASRATELSSFRDASVTPKDSPMPAHFFIAHGSLDTQVEPWHSQHLQDELRAVGLSEKESQLLILPGQGHGFTGAGRTQALTAATEFFKNESAQANPGPAQIWIKRPIKPFK